MNRTENGSESLCDGPKNISQNSSTMPLQENDLLSPSRRSKRIQKADLEENKPSDVLVIDKELPNGSVNNETTIQITDPSEKSCCSKNFQYDSSEYLFGLYDQEIENSHNPNHKFYGCKRKGFPSPCGESFGLPDDPIFSNSPIFLDRTKKSPLDIDLADPWDISVVDLEYVDQPWLVEYPEVITPYWDVESLFPFEVEDIRQKTEPEYDLSKPRSLSDSFNISGGILDASGDRETESDNVFTSTPVKNQNNSSLSVVSMINISSGEENNLNIAVLKDEVLRALEQAIKKKNNIGNIDMKIQIVTSDLKSPVTSPKKSSVEVRINENVETESCRSSSSSKENYFVDNTQVTHKTGKIINAKELNNVTLSDLNEDWKDSQGSEENEQSQDESNVNESGERGSTKKSKKVIKNKKNFVPGTRRSLRSQGPNISTSDKEPSTNSSVQLSIEDSSVKYAASNIISKKLLKTKASENQLDSYISVSNETGLQQSPQINLPNIKEIQSDRKRLLRSNYQGSQKEELIQSESNISKNINERTKSKDSQPVHDKDDSPTVFNKPKPKGKFTNEGLENSQSTGDIEVTDRSKRRSRFINEDSQSSLDESDNTASRFKTKIRGTIRYTEVNSSVDESVSKESTSKNKTKVKETIRHPEVENNVDENNSEETTIKNKTKIRGIIGRTEIDSSLDESDSKEALSKCTIKVRRIIRHAEVKSGQDKGDIVKLKKTGRLTNTELQTTKNEINISRNIGEQTQYIKVQSNQDENNTNKVVSEKSKDQIDLQPSHNDMKEISYHKSKKNKVLLNEETLSSQEESDTSNNIERRSLRRSQNNDSQSCQSEDDISKIVLENSLNGRSFKELLQLLDESSIKKNISKKLRKREKSLKEDLQSSQDESDISKDSLGKPKKFSRKLRNREKSLKEDLQSSQDEGDISKDSLEHRKKKGRPSKTKVQEKLNVSSNYSTFANIECSLKAAHQSVENIQDTTSDQIEVTPVKRVLRSSTQTAKPIVNELKGKRRRTRSNSVSEKGSEEQNFLSTRRRSVSANFDNIKSTNQRPPTRRSLRSQAAELTKNLDSIRSPEYSINKNSKANESIKSSKISFNLTNSFKESPKKFDTDSPLRSILKNVYDAAGRLIGVKVHREKHLKLPSALEIKPEDEDDFNSKIKPGFKQHANRIPEIELNSVKKEEEECLRENGITSQIKIVISPLEIKEETDGDVGKICPVLPLSLPKTDIPSLRKSGRISNIFQQNVSENQSDSTVKAKSSIPPQNINENKSDGTVKAKSNTLQQNVSENISDSASKAKSTIYQQIVTETILDNTAKAKSIPQQNDSEIHAGSTVKAKRKNEKVNNVSADVGLIGAKAKEIKIEEHDYSLGNIVWAAVGKYPFWPAIVCYDPITETFQKEGMKHCKPQIFYHIRFFGDHGRRAWVHRKHIMLYCTDQDLENIANKLKSENKNSNVIKPYLVTGSLQLTEKWQKAVKELSSLKNKKYDNIIKHMVHSYENHLKNRQKKRKHSMLDASSESESEEPDHNENNRRKKFKAAEYPHVTADAQIIENSFPNKNSEGFDEINITIGVQNAAVENTHIEQTTENYLENVHNSDITNESLNKQDERKPKRSIKGPEVINSAPTLPELSDNSEILDEITRRRSRRSLKPMESLNVTAESQDKSLDLALQANSTDISESLENLNVSSVKMGERRSLRAIKGSAINEIASNQKQPDERSEAESKTSSDGRSTNSNKYSFEYQVDLHKKNNLFNGLRNVKVCDYCLKQGDLYKCKGRCGGFFHLECASKVTQPRPDKRVRKRGKSPIKAKIQSAAESSDSTPKSNKSEDRCRTRNQGQVQIITIKTKHAIGTPKKVNLPPNFNELSLSERIDYSMKEMMSKFENRTVYTDSTDSSSEEGSIIASKNKQLGILDSPASSLAVESEKSTAKSSDLDENGEEEKSSDDLEVSILSESTKLIKHITADSVILTESETPVDITNLKCTYCRLELDPPCFACGLEVSKRGSGTRRKCSQNRCGRYYHPYCLKMWPQTQWSIGKWSRNQEQEDCFSCPAHTCHTCFSEELGSAACRLPGDKLARCMMCPAGFHTTTFCIPAGTDVLGGSQIVCPRHRPKPTQPINTIWCFICSEGGNLICCDTCPTSVHPECQPINLTDDDKYICEDCESGRFPLYDEIVWVKLGQYRWWPALVLFPNETPENVRALKHQRGDFAVRFFGTNDHYWVNKARSFLFQEGDRGGSPGEANKSKNKVYETFDKAIEDAALAYKLKKEFKLRREAECINSLKPPTYVKINKNRPVGNVKSLELDLSNATACECDPRKPHPCGPDSNCINRLLMTECDPDVCPAGNRCRNQAFQRREYPPMLPYKTQGRGWGLKCLAPIKKGQFVIEYVGELIDSEEYQRRIQKMHEQKEENYYFMTVDSDRTIDAGPKGNLSRFMNHCCNPNCVTQKWTVRGDTRVGLFAKCNIESGSELTFNYNLEVVGQEKKVCKCGASNCSGFIGVKAKSDKPEKPQTDPVTEPTEPRRPRKYNKKRAVSPPLIPPCFMCGRKHSDLTCNNKFCNKGYHLKCLKLEDMPEVTKFTCPRHNCNICSNRTIRCCVKCTNSFCPSHSEGNVRHDKFLGFVCRLHDPGILSTGITSQTIREKGKRNIQHNNKKSKNKSIHSYPPEEREAIRAMWRYRKNLQYQRERNLKKKLNKSKKLEINELKDKVETLAATFGKNLKKITSKQRQLSAIPVKRLKQDKSKSLNRTAKKYKLCKENEVSPPTKYGRLRGHGKGILNITKRDKELIRASWRECQRLCRIRKKEKAQNSEAMRGVTNTQVNAKTNVQESDLTSNQENETNDRTENISKLQGNHMTNIDKTDVETVQENALTTVPDDILEVKEDGAPEVQNITSKNRDDSSEVTDVTQSVRSEFEPIKSTKRRRQKPYITDESTVSSTTSDEDSNPKTSDIREIIERETQNAQVNDTEKDDPVSSTPPKELLEVLEPQEFQESDLNASEDELTLDKRIKRRPGVRNPRKKIRVNVKSLVTTVKTSLRQ